MLRRRANGGVVVITRIIMPRHVTLSLHLPEVRRHYTLRDV